MFPSQKTVVKRIVKKATEIMNDMDCDLNRGEIDRAHRISLKKTDEEGVTSQQIIVKLKSFR